MSAEHKKHHQTNRKAKKQKDPPNQTPPPPFGGGGGRNEWLLQQLVADTSRLRLNPTKTRIMWFRSGQQLRHADINNIPLLSTTVHRERARPWSCPRQPADTIGARRSALSVWLLPAQTTSSARPIDDGDGSCKNRSCGVYFLPVGLLQFAALRADTLLRKLQSVQNATTRLIMQ